MLIKRNNIWIYIGIAVLLFCMPFQATATDFYCSPKEITLPYPGMVSDNPLYVVKKIRDKILEQFIHSPAKKLEYYLFESKKNFAETPIQNERKNDAYVIRSGLRSANYMTLFVSAYHQIALSDASIQNTLVCDFYSTVEFQIKKYRELISALEDGELKKQLVSFVGQLELNITGFDNLLTTMNSKRIRYE